MACSSQKNRQPYNGPVTTAAGISSANAPQGPFPRGTVNPANLPNPATIGPVISILSPSRGTQTTNTTLTVQTKVEDSDGVASVQIGGVIAHPIGTDTYQATVTLNTGLNAVLVEAQDNLGNVSTSYVSVLQGLFVPDDQVYASNIAVSLTQDGLSRLDGVLESQLSQIDLWSLIQGANPLLNTLLVDVRATGIHYLRIRPITNGAPNGITLILEIDGLSVDADVDAVGFSLTKATLSATQARATVSATLDRSLIPPTTPVKQALGLKINSVAIDLTGFDIKCSSGVINTLLSPFRGVLQGVVERTLSSAIVDLADQALSGSITAIDVPARIPLEPATSGNAALGLQVVLDRANGIPGNGVDMVGGVKLTHQGTITEPNAPREVYVHGGPAQIAPAAPGDQFSLTISSDVMNGLLHSAWIQGALQFEIDGTQPPTTPTSTPLSVSFLYPFLPPVRDLAPDPNTPIVIQAAVRSAPLVRFPTFGSAAELAAGDLEVSLFIDYMDGGPRVELFTLRAALQLEGEVDISATEVRLVRLQAKQALLDVIREPTVDIADQEIETFFNAAVPFLVNQFAVQNVPPIPIPALPLGLQPKNPRVEAVPGFITVRGGL